MGTIESKHEVEPELADVVRVGGPPDRQRVSLCVYADDLEPELVTNQLGVPPTRYHRRGELFGRKQLARGTGAWILAVEGAAGADVQDVLSALLSQLPDEASVWSELSARHQVVVSFGVFLGEAWNRGFEFAPATVARLATMRAELAFDIYAD